MRCSVKVEAFFVPFRLLAGSFESWFTDSEKRFAAYKNSSGATMVPTSQKGFLPVIGGLTPESSAGAGDNDQSAIDAILAAGGLFDYLGCKSPNAQAVTTYNLSAMPPLAYHRVYHDWYRNTLVQTDVFLPPTNSTSSSISPVSYEAYAGTAPYSFFLGGVSGNPNYVLNSTFKLCLRMVSTFTSFGSAISVLTILRLLRLLRSREVLRLFLSLRLDLRDSFLLPLFELRIAFSNLRSGITLLAIFSSSSVVLAMASLPLMVLRSARFILVALNMRCIRKVCIITPIWVPVIIIRFLVP
jgi:hypothetical protein